MLWIRFKTLINKRSMHLNIKYNKVFFSLKKITALTGFPKSN